MQHSMNQAKEMVLGRKLPKQGGGDVWAWARAAASISMTLAPVEKEKNMSAQLVLASVNTNPVLQSRLDGRALHDLADRLTEQVQAGHPELAQVIPAFENLSPFGIAIVATWMSRAGLSEKQILEVVE